ncbi:sulfonate transport system substrate-binding protein [Pseudomonas psychrotolerans]|nr:sulfonate transport system substrate-binding protein [Pseudomonas psychrotolerans]
MCLLAGLCWGLATYSSAAELELRIGYLRGPSELALVKADGSLERELAAQGVKLKWLGPFSAAAPAYEALNAGALDVTLGASTAFITAIAGGIPMSMFAYKRMSPGSEGIVVRAAAPIHELADLRGRKVAVNRGGTGEYLLSRALETAGMPPDSVDKEYLTPTDSTSAFANGHVDGWATWDPFLALAQNNYDGRLLVNGAQLGSENASGYFVRQSFLRDHPQLVRTLFESLRKANDWARGHPLEAGRIRGREINASESVAEQLGRNDTGEVLKPLGSEEVHHLANIADWYVRQGIVRECPDVSAHVVDVTTLGR